MSVTLAEAESYVNALERPLNSQMETLKIKLSSISSKIYLSHGRLKTKESVYLKTKRKSKHLSEIYDYAGLRLLCLFEDDIIEVHKDFIRLLRVVNGDIDKNYELKTCSVYNWDKDYEESIKCEVNKYYQEGVEYEFESQKKSSGYKSIHYVVREEGQVGWIEVQLRTLIQDVWGQLEHSISYKKGGVHPHIRKSFYLLSKDLSNIECLLTYLRVVNNKEAAGEEYFNKSEKPKYVFNYENAIFPIIFNTREKLKKASDAYWEMVSAVGEVSITTDWVNAARGYLDIIEDGISARELKNPELTYWLKMEKAFLLFCEERHEDSLEIYKDIEKDYKDRYCVYFRMGELYFILGYIVQALDAFDKAESLLKITDGLGLINQYRIKTKLAYSYWRLGEEYIDICNEEIDDARDKFYVNPDEFTEKELLALINNVCWYRLEKYIILQNRFLCEKNPKNEKKALIAYEDVTKEFAAVEKCLQDGGKEVSHMLDTAAWYCYWAYKHDTRNNEYLSMAKKYAYALNDMAKRASPVMSSMKTYMAHIQEIMSE